jgi:hypothetical protein
MIQAADAQIAPAGLALFEVRLVVLGAPNRVLGHLGQHRVDRRGSPGDPEPRVEHVIGPLVLHEQIAVAALHQQPHALAQRGLDDDVAVAPPGVPHLAEEPAREDEPIAHDPAEARALELRELGQAGRAAVDGEHALGPQRLGGGRVGAEDDEALPAAGPSGAANGPGCGRSRRTRTS